VTSASACHSTAAPTYQHYIAMHKRQRVRNADISCLRSAWSCPAHFDAAI